MQINSANTSKFINKFKSKLWLSLLLITFCVLIVLRSSNFWNVLRLSILSSSSSPSSPSPTPTNDQDNNECQNLRYTNKISLDLSRTITVDEKTKQEILLNLHDEDFVKQLVGSVNNLRDIQYSSKAQKLAYLEGVDVERAELGPIVVHLYDLQTKQDRVIDTYQTKKLKQEGIGLDYDALRDVAFSPDGSRLIVVSNSQVWIYIIKTGELKLVYSNQKNASRSAFYDPILSEDNSKVILRVGFFEGSSFDLLNLKNGRLTELPYSGYGGGTYVFGWKGQNFLIYKYGEQSDICTATITGKDLKCFKNLPFDFGDLPTIDGDRLLKINRIDGPSGQYVCNNIGQRYEITTQYRNIDEMNLKTGQTKTLFQVDSTDSSGVDREYEIQGYTILTLNGVPTLVIKLDDHGQTKYLTLNSNQLNDVSVIHFE